MRASEQCKVIGVGGPKRSLNCTLVIDSPFQTFTLGLLVEFNYRPLLSPETLSSLSKLRILFNVHLALFVRRMT